MANEREWQPTATADIWHIVESLARHLYVHCQYATLRTWCCLRCGACYLYLHCQYACGMHSHAMAAEACGFSRCH